MKFNITRSSSAAYFLAALTVLTVGTAKQAAAADVATTLATNPNFSDFVTELRITGLWSSLQDAQNVTIFAPTNAAFDRTRPGWKVQLMDAMDTSATYGSKEFGYQTKLRSAFISGVHPVTDFAGKAQTVHTLGSTAYWVDGRDGSTLKVEAKAPSSAEIGMPPAPTQTAELSLPPIATSNGLIYPLNAVIR
jgi:uncharacterized surface protein with fasciclin (FAS1) repeats